MPWPLNPGQSRRTDTPILTPLFTPGNCSLNLEDVEKSITVSESIKILVACIIFSGSLGLPHSHLGTKQSNDKKELIIITIIITIIIALV
jgi:hypothetical protein